MAQTCLDLLRHGFSVFLPVDAISSQRAVDRDTALTRLSNAGAVLTTSESACFEILRDAKHPAFRSMLALAKEYAKQR